MSFKEGSSPKPTAETPGGGAIVAQPTDDTAPVMKASAVVSGRDDSVDLIPFENRDIVPVSPATFKTDGVDLESGAVSTGKGRCDVATAVYMTGGGYRVLASQQTFRGLFSAVRTLIFATRS